MSELLTLLADALPPPPEWWVTVERDLRAPYPYFGGKQKIAELAWERMGEVVNYVEPFFGSGAVLLARPHAPTIETVNDLDGMVVNFWRAIREDPSAVAAAADWPVTELDLHARHKYLTKIKQRLAARLLEDPTYYNATIAGWWVWGLCAWIGSGWCSGRASKQMPGLAAGGCSGMGVHARGMRGGKMPFLQGCDGRTDHGKGAHSLAHRSRLPEVFAALAARLRYTRVTCGDFERILSPAVTWRHGLTGVFLDPPYPADAGSTGGLYTSAKEEREVFDRAFRWASANGGDKRMRIAFCYYDGTLADGKDVSEQLRAAGWDVVSWKSKGGYGSQSEGENVNAKRERIAFSPACLTARQASLF